jgi:hypothetical protein
MKLLTKIQSISDIITNSSSETFLMHQEDAEYYDSIPSDGCISIDAVGEGWIRNNYWEKDLICNFLNIEELDDDCFSSEDWNAFVDLYIMPHIDKFDDIYSSDHTGGFIHFVHIWNNGFFIGKSYVQSH